MADYVLVMKDGKVVEEGETEQIFAAPGNYYTKALMSAAFDLTAFGSN
jgi:oligopeptide transport system ATP-binding protein